ncbi:hypothetical protein GEV33_006811 [Tenebrio molitor]|uniref:Phosphatidylinositol-glycan biosynthesis class W protein n=1 Tax=Tenebrio molitor TaxID=7067 RepID=A0A8J6HKI6_TENMO|nr:hypothetical protein GEV33_006811 [Tenebrio molitor]
MIDSYEKYKQIDDIIDARKKLGQYNVCKQPTPINYRYAYSSAATTSDKFIRFDDATMLANEGDFLNSSDIKSTDSEITIVRVRCDGLAYKRRPSKWDMHDIAIPGDGSHLGESPSMVNLATLVQQNDEYLVPLSSWDPYCKTDDAGESAYACLNKIEKVSDEDCSTTSQFSEENSLSSKNSTNSRRPSLAGRISKFLRRHCKKSKTLPEPMDERRVFRDRLMHSDGTTPFETISLILPTLFYTTIITIVVSILRSRTHNLTLQFCTEFATLVIPIILNVTILADYTLQLLSTSCIICLSLLFWLRTCKTPPNRPPEASTRDYITNSRSTIHIISVVAILAVDFLVFPRRFAKTETFGYSLMDVGVGLFMFSNGIVDGGRTSLRKAFAEFSFRSFSPSWTSDSSGSTPLC